jgi:hypothetical protein
LSNAEELRNKLIRIYKQIEMTSDSIMKYGITYEHVEVNTADPNNNTKHEQQLQPVLSISKDQFKLQRNIRYYAINYLKEHSFNLPQLPTPQDYEKLKSKRQTFLIEEMKRQEMEQQKQRKIMEEQVAKRQPKAQNKRKAFSKNNNYTIDNVNGWMPSKPSIQLGEDVDKLSINENDSDSASLNSRQGALNDDDKTNAIRIQIQIVEGYLSDALKQNRMDEAKILEKNLQDLWDILENSK